MLIPNRTSSPRCEYLAKFQRYALCACRSDTIYSLRLTNDNGRYIRRMWQYIIVCVRSKELFWTRFRIPRQSVRTLRRTIIAHNILLYRRFTALDVSQKSRRRSHVRLYNERERANIPPIIPPISHYLSIYLFFYFSFFSPTKHARHDL